MLFRMSAEAAARRLTTIGVALFLTFAAVCLFFVINPTVTSVATSTAIGMM